MQVTGTHFIVHWKKLSPTDKDNNYYKKSSTAIAELYSIRRRVKNSELKNTV